MGDAGLGGIAKKRSALAAVSAYGRIRGDQGQRLLLDVPGVLFQRTSNFY
jgi:hypothetical protein